MEHWVCSFCRNLIKDEKRTRKDYRCLACAKHMGLEPEKDLKSEGVKYDEGKNQMELLSARWIEGVGEVLTFGARKYKAHNWRLGIQRSRLLGASLRHIFAYLRGEDRDPETGFLHLHHASCCLMFASELHYTKPETDDRWKDEKHVDKLVIKDETVYGAGTLWACSKCFKTFEMNKFAGIQCCPHCDHPNHVCGWPTGRPCPLPPSSNGETRGGFFK